METSVDDKKYHYYIINDPVVSNYCDFENKNIQ